MGQIRRHYFLHKFLWAHFVNYFTVYLMRLFSKIMSTKNPNMKSYDRWIKVLELTLVVSC